MKTVEFYYDFGSPNAFLVHKVLPGIAESHDAAVIYKPMLLGGVFKATNNQSPMQAFAGVRGKLDYQMKEIDRFIRRHGISFKMNPYFPINTLALMRGAVFCEGKPFELRYIEAIFDAIWSAGEKMDEPEVIRRVLTDAELPASDIFSAVTTHEVKEGLIAATGKAVDRGIFGAPTMFVGDEMFFGKDALSELEYHLARAD